MPREPEERDELDGLDEDGTPNLFDPITSDEIPDRVRPADRPAGPLVDPADEDVGDVDDESALVAMETDTDQALSAEEAAMHIVDEP